MSHRLSDFAFVAPSTVGDPLAKISSPLLLILDVDGVTRAGVEKRVDDAVIAAAKKLLTSFPQQVVGFFFLSGSPLDNDDGVEEWRRGNLPLRKAFEGCFSNEELRSGRVGIFGQVGTQRLVDNDSVETIDAFSQSTQHFVAFTLLEQFLEAVLRNGTGVSPASSAAAGLLKDLHQQKTTLMSSAAATAAKSTPDVFAPLVLKIRDTVDPTFRLVSSESLAEFHMDPRLANINAATKKVREQLRTAVPALAGASVFSGVAHRGSSEFAFLLVTLSNKGKAASRIIEEVQRHIKRSPSSGPTNINKKKLCTVTIGDGGVDYPMHVLADASFHVGPRASWEQGADLCDTVLVVNKNTGEASQHVRGTAFVLDSIFAKLSQRTRESKL